MNENYKIWEIRRQEWESQYTAEMLDKEKRIKEKE